ncbi:MAG: hypothetical protein KY466_02735 [Gemmatimonadetes bacterium]|nr:hypothetical protein [Gemmatimonadota bacterium]
MTTTRPAASVGAARAIAASLIAGVTTFALVAWSMVGERGPQSPDAAATGPVIYAWAVLACGALIAAMLVWRTRITPRLESPRGPRKDEPGRQAALQSALIVVWALLEGAALFGVVVYFLYGATFPLAGGLLLVWLGIGLTFPRSEWFPRSTGAG